MLRMDSVKVRLVFRSQQGNKAAKVWYTWAFLYSKHTPCILSMMYQHKVYTMYFEQMFQHFTYNISLIMFCFSCHSTVASSLFLWHNLAHFGTLLSTPANQVIKTFRREWWSNHGQFLPIKKSWSVHKDFYRWHERNYLLLCNYVYHTFCKWLRAMYWLHILRHQVAP